jgi:predicted metal-dependent hydrolase
LRALREGSRVTAHPLFRSGLDEYRKGRFFEAHEEWERLWKNATGHDRLFLQGLIQIAAGLVHLERGRRAPGLRLLGLAREKLARLPDDFGGIAVPRLREALDAAVAAGGETPPFEALAQALRL